MEVIWTKNAERDYYQQIDELLERWDDAIAEEFVNQAFAVIDYIIQHPNMYARTNLPGVRKAVINRHISLFYRVEAEKLFLLRFWPNRQDPKKIGL